MGACAIGNAGRPAIVLFLSLLFAGCVQPVHKASLDESFMKPDAGRKAWSKVAVLTFSGDPVFRRTAAEWLAFRIRRHGLFEIVDPSLAEIELGKSGILVGEDGIAVAEAQRAGQLLGVDGVVFGSADPPVRGMPESGGVRASVMDVKTGKVVGDSVRRYQPWGRLHRQKVMAGVDAVAEDLVAVLYAAAGKVWTPPPSSETDRRATPERETKGTGR